MAKLTEEEQNVIERAIWAIRCNLASEADRYYSNIIFQPDHPGQTAIEKYTALWGQEDDEIIAGLWDIIYKEEDIDEIVSDPISSDAMAILLIRKI